MTSRIWLMYGSICMSMVVYLFWSLHAMTCKERFQTPIQRCITDLNKERLCNTELSAKFKTSNVVIAPVQIKMFSPTIVNGTDINANISKRFTMTSKVRKDIFVNLHRFKFNINSDKCSKGDVFLIMVVHSATYNFRKRTLIRATYGSLQCHKGKKMTVVFVLGAVNNTTVQKDIYSESKIYGDIVQGNFPDTYKCLVRKHIMDMHWFKMHCNADFILKLDDDTFINPFRVVEYLLNSQPKGLTIHCRLLTGEIPLRIRNSKWYTPISQYPFPMFPSFCLGFAYLTTPETWNAMYIASKNTRKIDMDDVYVSAILGMKIQVNQINFEDILYKCPQNASLIQMERLNRKAIFVDRKPRCGEKPFLLWKDIRDANVEM